MNQRRADLDNVRLWHWLRDDQRKRNTHVGLWLNKYFWVPDGDENTAKGEWQRFVAEMAHPDAETEIYRRFFEDCWRPALEGEAQAGATLCREVTAQGRFVTGLGNASVLEVGLTLHHTYGVPYITGSGLKGLAAAYARQRVAEHDEQWKRLASPGTRPTAPATASQESDSKSESGPNSYHTLFGDLAISGIVDFEDALPLPGTWKLHSDVLTVHHRDYYGDKNQPPADWDAPVPVPFLSVTGTFLIALRGPRDWCKAAFAILEEALKDEGAGAKTSSGYGRMEEVKDHSERQ